MVSAKLANAVALNAELPKAGENKASVHSGDRLLRSRPVLQSGSGLVVGVAVSLVVGVTASRVAVGVGVISSPTVLPPQGSGISTLQTC